MDEGFEASIEQSLKRIFDAFSYSEAVPTTDVKKIFTAAEYMNVLHLIYTAVFSPANSQMVYSVLTAYIHEFLKKVVRSYVDNELPPDPEEFLRRFTRVMEHYEKLATFTEKFFIYGDKKEHLMFNFRELYSKKIFSKLFCEQILLPNQAKILTAVSGYLDERVTAPGLDAQPVWGFLAGVLLFADVEVASVAGFVKALAQRVQHEVTRQAARHFEGVAQLAAPQLIAETAAAKDTLEAHIGALFPGQKIFAESARQCHEFIRRLLASDVLARLFPKEAGAGADLFDTLDADGLVGLFRLVQAAHPGLRPLKAALEEYVKSRVRGLVGAPAELHFSALVAFFRRVDDLVALLGGDAQLQATVAECIDWVMSENAGLDAKPFTLQLKYIDMLKERVVHGHIDQREPCFATALAFVPFLDPKLFEAAFAQFFCRWVLNAHHRRGLEAERRLAQHLQAKLGEEPCKPFASVLDDIDEFRKSEEKFEEFLRREEFAGCPAVRVTHVFSAFVAERLPLPDFALLRSAQSLYTTFFLSQKHNANRELWLSCELGSCECELRVGGRRVAVAGTPLEVGLIAEVIERGGLTKAQMLRICSGGDPALEAPLAARLDAIVHKLLELGLFAEEQGAYRLARALAGNERVTVFAYDCCETQVKDLESAKPAAIDNSRVSSFAAHFAKTSGQFTYEQLRAAVDAEMPGLDAKRLSAVFANILELGIVKRVKNSLDAFHYSSR